MIRTFSVVLLATLLASSVAVAQTTRPAQPRVDVEVAYVKFFSATDRDALKKRFAGTLMKAISGIKVADKEWYPRWKRHQVAYGWIPGGPAAIKEHVKNEVRVGKLLASLAPKVKAGTDLKALAEKNGLSFHRYEKATRRDLQLHPDVGSPRAMMMLWGSGVDALKSGRFKLGSVVPYETRSVGRYWEGCFDEPGNFMAIYRLVKVHDAAKSK